MTRRRIILRVIVLLLLGAVINVAVAWGCATTVSLVGEPDNVAIGTLHSERWSVWSVIVFSKVGSELCYSTLDNTGHLNSDAGDPGALVPEWFPEHQAWTTQSAAHGLVGEARGWPCRALRALWEVDLRDGANTQQVVSGIDLISLPWRTPVGTTLPRILPLRPIWPGFAINTIFYAALLWGLWLVFCVGPGFVRRRIRRGRGQCLHCGYDLRGQPPEAGASGKCPECGDTMSVRPLTSRQCMGLPPPATPAPRTGTLE